MFDKYAFVTPAGTFVKFTNPLVVMFWTVPWTDQNGEKYNLELVWHSGQAAAPKSTETLKNRWPF